MQLVAGEHVSYFRGNGTSVGKGRDGAVIIVRPLPRRLQIHGSGAKGVCLGAVNRGHGNLD